MKLKKLAFIALVVISVYSQSSVGSYYVGSEVLADCESLDPVNRNYCTLYIAGIVDAYGTLSGWGKLNEKEYCVPASVTIGQVRKVFIKHANENPQKLHNTASSMVMNAIYYAFPCE